MHSSASGQLQGFQAEALLRIAHSRDVLVSLWSDLQARKMGSGDDPLTHES